MLRRQLPPAVGIAALIVVLILFFWMLCWRHASAKRAVGKQWAKVWNRGQSALWQDIKPGQPLPGFPQGLPPEAFDAQGRLVRGFKLRPR